MRRVKKTVCITTTVMKVVFRTATKCNRKYLNSPLYKGTLLWNDLSPDQQRADNVLQFVKGIHRLYVVYQEIW